MEKEQAKVMFRSLVAKYGLQWTRDVPSEAWELMSYVNRVLDEGDRREALGLRREKPSWAKQEN